MTAVALGADHAGEPWTILCVDDEPNILAALKRLFRPHGWEILTADSGEAALALLVGHEVHVVISDMRMPGMDGAQLLAEVHARHPSAARILLTGQSDLAATIAAINQGRISRYLHKPWEDQDLILTVREAIERLALEKERERLQTLIGYQNEELKRLNEGLEAKVQARTEELRVAAEKLRGNFLTSIKVFSGLMEMRHRSMAGHARRVAETARKLAQQFQLDSAVSQDLMLASLLHDLGLISLPDRLLDVPEIEMNAMDKAVLRQHPVKSASLLMGIDNLRNACVLIRAHHENFDGSGYPDGLVGEAIPLGARILRVANDYDDMQQGVLFRQPVTAEEARKYLHQCRRRLYDPKVVDALLRSHMLPEEPATGQGRRVPVADIRPGMVLAKALVNREGLVLLAEGYILDEVLIRVVRDYAANENPALLLVVKEMNRAQRAMR